MICVAQQALLPPQPSSIFLSQEAVKPRVQLRGISVLLWGGTTLG